MAKIKLVKRVKYAGDIHKKLVELGWDLDTAALFCDDLPDADVAPVRHGHCAHFHPTGRNECADYRSMLNGGTQPQREDV